MTDAWLDYELPAELVAQHPLENRADARLLVVDRRSQSWEHGHVRDLGDWLRPGDRIVLNDTRVLPASLRGRRASTGGRWQGLFLGEGGGRWELLCKTRGKLTPPEAVVLDDPQGRPVMKLWLLERLEGGRWRAQPESEETALQILARVGRTPLPPYIRGGNMSDSDVERYQTVFAKRLGAVAAPTAGLHFSERLLRGLAQLGVKFSAVTLHVGQGTFQPIAAEDPGNHPMHAEWGELSAETAAEIEQTRAEGGRIVAVGTTVVRVLETAAQQAAGGSVEGDSVEGGRPVLRAWSGHTQLYIRPPYQYRAVDALMTNFHFPRTTLLLLVQAFAGTALTRAAYEAAIAHEYRFYSYGDAMLIL